MTRPHSKSRRGLLTLIGLAALPVTPVAAQPAIRIEGGVPQRLPLTTIRDLDIAQPAQIDEDPVDLAVLNLGVVDVPSGRLTGVDALLLDGAPYRPRIASGRYPLQVVLARLPSGEERVAFVQLKLADRNAESWSNAIIEGEDELQDDEISVFEVESSVAALFDAAALALWRRSLAERPELLVDLQRVLRENRRPTWTWAHVQVGSGSGVLFTAGRGEGEYGAYWGRGADGQIVSLVIDLDLLDWAGLPEDPPVTV